MTESGYLFLFNDLNQANHIQDTYKKTIKHYWLASLKYKRVFFAVMASVTAVTIVDTITPLYFKKFFDILSSASVKSSAYVSLLSVLLTIFALNVFGWLLWRVVDFANSHFQTRAMSDLLNQSFAYLHKHSVSFFDNNFSGALVKKVNYFASSFESISDKLVYDLVPLLVTIITIIIVLAFKNPIIGLGIFLWVIAYLLINFYIAKKKLKYDFTASEAQTETTGDLADTIVNQINVKLFNGYGNEVEKFQVLTKKAANLLRFAWNFDSLFRGIQALLIIVFEILLFYLGVRLWLVGKFGIGDFVLLQAYILSIVLKIWGFGNTIRRIYRDLANAEEMTIVFETAHEIVDARGAKSLKVNRGEIEFKNVDFCYHETRNILKKLNLAIAPGEKVALIGPSGAGKTTIIKLLLRAYDVSGGNILIDGQKISQVTLESLWQNISLVPQDPILFHRSLLENIRYGKPSASDEEVIAAAKSANCHDFIMDFPEQYRTLVGERGVKLSGGERQRVAIARAILRNAPILLLDEATSSLDSESESYIQEALDRLMRDKTVVIIAHRLSTIRKVDRIIFVDEGVITEAGTHEELLNRQDSHYRQLWQLQAGGFMP